MRIVTTRLEEKFEFDAPKLLFTFPFLPFSTSGVTQRVYDVTPDGKRILTIATPETMRPWQIDVVTNWTTELARLVATTAK